MIDIGFRKLRLMSLDKVNLLRNWAFGLCSGPVVLAPILAEASKVVPDVSILSTAAVITDMFRSVTACFCKLSRNCQECSALKCDCVLFQIVSHLSGVISFEV